MTREEKIVEARHLRRHGLTLREIAEELGMSGPSAAWRLLNPDKAREQERRRNTYKREYDRKRRQSCPSCGGLLGEGSDYPGSTVKLCRECENLRRRTDADERFQQVEDWWREGKSFRWIADQLGISRGTLSALMDRMRGRGYNLPYRYQLSRPAHRDQLRVDA